MTYDRGKMMNNFKKINKLFAVSAGIMTQGQ